MGKLEENQNSTAGGNVPLKRRSNRAAFRRVLYVHQSQRFLAELCNPGLWNDFVVEMVRLLIWRQKYYDCSRVVISMIIEVNLARIRGVQRRVQKAWLR